MIRSKSLLTKKHNKKGYPLLRKAGQIVSRTKIGLFLRKYTSAVKLVTKNADIDPNMIAFFFNAASIF